MIAYQLDPFKFSFSVNTPASSEIDNITPMGRAAVRSTLHPELPRYTLTVFILDEIVPVTTNALLCGQKSRSAAADQRSSRSAGWSARGADPKCSGNALVAATNHKMVMIRRIIASDDCILAVATN